MKATLYKTLSNQQTIRTVQAHQPVYKAFPDIDFENAVIIVNGRKTTSDYILKENDILMIRSLPSGVATAISIIIGVAAIATATYAGIQAYKAKKAAEEAQEELDKLKKLTNSDIDNRPFLRGASNTVATNKTQPYICGRNLFTPYILCNPFYVLSGTDGADEYTYEALEGGFNKQIIQKLNIDDILVKTFSDTTPQEGAYNFDSGSTFAEDGKIEISQDGALLTDLPEVNYKYVSTACNDEIPRDSKVASGDDEYLTYTLDEHAKNVDVAISFPYGLYAYNSDNDKIATSVTVTPQYSLDGGNSWSDFTFNNNGTSTNVFIRNVSSKELRYCAHKEFSLNDYKAVTANGQTQIWIRIRSNGNDDTQIKNDVYCLFYQSLCFDPNKSSTPAGVLNDSGSAGLVNCLILEDRERAYCTILGIRVKATKLNKDKLKKINIITQGTARTWNGTAWSTEKTATSNPAAWALEILTSDSHQASKFSDSEIDFDSFADFYTFCENNSYHFNYVITQNQKKEDTIGYIMDACGACIYWDIYGRLAVAVDTIKENAIAVYNPQDIISISNKKTLSRRTDGLRIKYANGKNDLFTEDTYLVMRDGQTLEADSIIKDLSVSGITEYDHIVKYARRLMAIESLRPKTTTIEVGNEGVYFTPYSKVLVQDDSLKVGTGHGVIKSVTKYGGLIKTIVLNNPVTFDETKTYGVVVNAYNPNNGTTPLALKVSGTGTTDTLTLLTQVRISDDLQPEAGNILSFGELDTDGEFTKITTPYLIGNIKRASGTGFTLELVNYNTAIYDAGTIPEYSSNITNKKTPSTADIPSDYVTEDESNEAIKNAAQEVANVVTNGVHFTNVHKISDISTLSLELLQQEIDEDANTASASISMSHDEVMIRVEDEARELRATLDIQASAILAQVEGGGAIGQMSLSLELPVMITADVRAKLVAVSNESAVAAVYAALSGTEYYAIKGNASNAAVKALWDDAVGAGLLASQIVIDADQIQVNAANIFINGKLQADYIDVEQLAAEQAFITSLGTQDITVSGKLTATNAEITGKITATSGSFINGNFQDCTLGGFLYANNTPFKPVAMIDLGYNNSAIQLTNNKNISSVSRDAKGTYTITLTSPVKLKTHSYNGNRYIDLFVIGNAADSFDSGFSNPLIPTCNWLRKYVDGRLTVDELGYATVSYFVLYFADNSSDSLQDPISSQIFVFGTEADE